MRFVRRHLPASITHATIANDPILVPLTKDSVRLGHWSVEKQAVTSTDIAAFNNSGWYANIQTPANPNGAIRGQLTMATAPATTLTQLQSTLFTPKCSGCHTGGGASLPSSTNPTTAANSYAALVGVASTEQGTVMRVAPNNAAGSYLVRKLEGAVTIIGARMPFGGPYLDQPTDTVQPWINSGAPNN